MYWGTHVKVQSMDFYVQAKIHGPNNEINDSEQLTEFIRNLPVPEDRDHLLARYYAGKIAKAFKGHPDALWVTVDIVRLDGAMFGETKMIEGADLS